MSHDTALPTAATNDNAINVIIFPIGKKKKKNLVSQQELYCFFPGQSQLIGPPQPIVAILGGDIILPCHLEPAVDVAARTVEWSRPDLEPRFVHVWRNGQDLVMQKHPSYERRTSLSIDKLKHGDISLKLSEVKLSDEGRYRCFIPLLGTESAVELVVDGTASSPVIHTSKSSSGVVLECESKGWYPEPELFWLDAEGKLLSAGAPETVRGPDGLYTVSSRVTVEKSHSNSFTCRVQQLSINQSRDTHIHFHINVMFCVLSFQMISSWFPLTLLFLSPSACLLSSCVLLLLSLLCGNADGTKQVSPKLLPQVLIPSSQFFKGYSGVKL
uniref:Ig-like domain-containing protein n=1 Tax=Myripristis murdjan TaxID=586833 RepID=A0A667YV65_9TELE